MGLNSTFFDVEEMLPSNIAHGWFDLSGNGSYDDISLISRTGIYSVLWTSGAVFSTAEDLANWSSALFGGKVISQSSLDKMLTSCCTMPGTTDVGCGMGVYLIGPSNNAGVELIGYTGRTFGYLTSLFYLPDYGISVTVIINEDNSACLDAITTNLILEAMNHGQELPEVKVNHLNFVLEFHDLKAIRESGFVNDTLAACETRIAKVENHDTSFVTYFFGHSNYLELFDASGDDLNLGFLGMGFSVDKIGGLDTLKSFLDETYFTGKNSKAKTIDSISIPWFDVLVVNDFSLMDSAFMAQLHFWFWIMEYKSEYFDYNNYTIDNNELTRENYLEKYAAKRKNKILKKFTGIVMKLNPDEKEYLTKFFDIIDYKRLSGNEYMSPDKFKFIINNRHPGDHNSIESLRFEASENFLSNKTVKISDNIIITIEGNEGQILFK